MRRRSLVALAILFSVATAIITPWVEPIVHRHVVLRFSRPHEIAHRISRMQFDEIVHLFGTPDKIACLADQVGNLPTCKLIFYKAVYWYQMEIRIGSDGKVLDVSVFD